MYAIHIYMYVNDMHITHICMYVKLYVYTLLNDMYLKRYVHILLTNAFRSRQVVTCLHIPLYAYMSRISPMMMTGRMPGRQ